MNDYIGKICPYCKTEFKPGDDIVVCSACDMPHHKDCWVENQGCTTFGCSGTIKTADGAASSVTATQMSYDDVPGAAAPVNSGAMFCSRCGAQNGGGAAFCARCGNRLTAAPERAPQPPVYTQPTYTQPTYTQPTYTQPTYTQPTYTQPTYTQPTYTQPDPSQAQNGYPYGGYNTYQPYAPAGVDPELQQLVGTKTEYYIPRFQAMKTGGSSSSWNWAAFLVTPYWMMYRKMYGYAAAVLAVDIVISLIGSGVLSLLVLGCYIAFGILGNSIYMKFLEGKANQAKAMSEPYKSQFITENGGVNATATVLTIIGRALLVGFLL